MTLATPATEISNPNPLTEMALEAAIPGLNGALQPIIDEYRIKRAASVLLAFKRFSRRFTPSPRLVGVETNPGPKTTRKSLLAAIRETGSFLGAAAARKKKQAKKPSKRVSFALGNSMNTRLIAAPAIAGVVSQPAAKHTPFVVSGRSIMFYVASNSTTLTLTNAGSTATPVLGFSVDPVTAGTESRAFTCFNSTIRNIAGSFIRYRMRKAILHLSGLAPTSSGGSIVVGANPEIFSGNYVGNNYGEVAAMENSVILPTWGQATLNCLAKGGWDPSWKVVDSNGPSSATTAGLRQECPGSLTVGGIVSSTITDGVILTATLEFEIEFDSLGRESIYGLTNTNMSQPSPLLPAASLPVSSSSSSSYVQPTPSLCSSPHIMVPHPTLAAPASGWFQK